MVTDEAAFREVGVVLIPSGFAFVLVPLRCRRRRPSVRREIGLREFVVRCVHLTEYVVDTHD